MNKYIKYTLVCLWFAVVSLAYYRLYPFKDIILGFPKITSFEITGQFASNILILCLFMISASGWGRIFWYQHHLFYLEKLILSSGCGLGVISFLVLAGNFAGVTSNVYYFAILLIGLIIFFTAAGKIHEHVMAETDWWMLILLIPIVSSLIGALAPPTQYDSLVYHLTLPLNYLKHGGIYFVPDNVFFSFPQVMEMIYQSAISIDSTILANLMHWVFLVLTGAAIYSFSKRFLGKKTGVLASIIWFFTPAVLFLSTGTYVDLALAFFVFISFYNIILYIESEHNFWLYASGFYSGIALGIKYTAIIYILIFAALIFVKTKDKLTGLSNISKYLASAFAMFLPWIIKNIIYIKNPIAPWGTGFFSSSRLPVETGIKYLANVSAHGMPIKNLIDIIKIPWKLTAYGFNYGGGFDILGPAFLLFIPILLLCFIHSKYEVKPFCSTHELKEDEDSESSSFGGSARNIKIIALMTLSCFTVWLCTGKVLRFLTPVLPFMCLLSSEGVMSISKNAFVKAFAYTILTIALIHNLLLFHWVMGSVDPYSIVIGKETSNAYLARKINSYNAIDTTINNLPKNAKVLSWGETRGCYFKAVNITPTIFDKHPLIGWITSSKDYNDLGAYLKKEGITHILVNNFEVNRLGYNNMLTAQGKEVFEEFKSKSAKKIYEDKYCQVYELTI